MCKERESLYLNHTTKKKEQRGEYHMKAKKRNILIVALAIVLVTALSVGGTLAYMTDSESLLNTFKVGDLDVTISEPDYCDQKVDERVPGDAFAKNPTIRQVDSDAYMRVIVEFLKKDGVNYVAIDSSERLELIKQTIYYDRNFSSTPVGGYIGSDDLKLVWKQAPTFPHTPDSTYHYTAAQLAGKVNNPAGPINNWFNMIDFELDSARSTDAKVVLNYKNAATGDIFKEKATAVVFTSIVFPSDWNQIQLAKMGEYYIRVTVEEIQAVGFGGRTEAMTKLDESSKLVDYKTVGG